MPIRIQTNTAQAQQLVRKIKAAIQGPGGKKIVTKVAFWALGQLIERTPKKWTGQVRRSWTITAIRGGYRITNTNKVMAFLELGTTAHGPVTAKALYIPLNATAAMGWKPSLVMGVDYILRRRVHGIWNGATGVKDPRGRVAEQRTLTEQKLFAEMRDYLQGVIHG